MKRKLVVVLVLVACLLGAVGAGAAYMVVSLREKRLAAEIEAAREYVNLEDYPNAEKTLGALIERSKGTEPYYPELLAMNLKIQRKQRRWDAARIAAHALLDPKATYPDEFLIPAHTFLGQDALDEENVEKAKMHFERILAMADKAEGRGLDVAKLGLIRIRMATEGVTPETQKELQALLDAYPDSEAREDIEFALGHCNVALLLSPIQMEGDVIHTIAKGDTIYGIARKYKVPQETLMGLNGIRDAKSLSIGRRLKIPKVDFSIVVDKSNNTLTLLNGGKFFKRYLVRTGRVDYLTPIGEFEIQNKKIDPEWNDPNTGQKFGPGDPGNELGTRWMGFQGSNLGIHGTIRPETIGTYASNGCVGMLKEDVEELFDLVNIGTPIKIVGSINQKLVVDPPPPAAAAAAPAAG